MKDFIKDIEHHAQITRNTKNLISIALLYRLAEIFLRQHDVIQARRVNK